MSDYLKIPTLPPKDGLPGVAAVAPYPRIDSHHSPSDDSRQSSSAAGKEPKKRTERRFILLRQLIARLEETADIVKLDYATADAELRQLGLSSVEENLIPQLLRLKIPLQAIARLQEQLNAQQPSISLGRGRLIQNDATDLFPVSAAGLAEYILKIDHLHLKPRSLQPKIAQAMDQEGFFAVQGKRLRLTLSPSRSTQSTDADVSLRIVALLGGIENEEDGSRAILFPRTDGSYGLYADKMIDLSI